MSYRNKTYVAFASEDIDYYWMMEAWKRNKKIDFTFLNAHDLFKARDTSKPLTIKRNLRERMKNAKQVVLLGSREAKRKGSDGTSFLAHEVAVALEFDLPIVVANLDDDREVDENFIPTPILEADHFTMSVAFRMKIIQYALDHYAPSYKGSSKTGSYYYKDFVYQRLGLND